MEIYLINTDDDRPYLVVAISRRFVLFRAKRLLAGSVIGGGSTSKHWNPRLIGSIADLFSSRQEFLCGTGSLISAQSLYVL